MWWIRSLQEEEHLDIDCNMQEDIVLSAVSKVRQSEHCRTPLLQGSWRIKSIEMKGRTVVVRGWGRWEVGMEGWC